MSSNSLVLHLQVRKYEHETSAPLWSFLACPCPALPHPCPCPAQTSTPTPNQDLYEYDLNCKSIAANLASVRGLPDLKMLGLPRNVLVWDGEQLGTWLDALGLGQVVAHLPSLTTTSPNLKPLP